MLNGDLGATFCRWNPAFSLEGQTAANTFTSATIELAEDQQVVSTGPYARVRHPMYAGALLMLLATPIALGSWRGVLMFIPMLAAILWRLQDEERYLSHDHAGYPSTRPGCDTDSSLACGDHGSAPA